VVHSQHLGLTWRVDFKVLCEPYVKVRVHTNRDHTRGYGPKWPCAPDETGCFAEGEAMLGEKSKTEADANETGFVRTIHNRS
jgi:hypothetical protein